MDTQSRQRTDFSRSSSTVTRTILTGAIVLLASCSGDCGENRQPQEIPERVSNEGSGLLTDHASFQQGEGTGERRRPEHRQGEGSGSGSILRRSDDPAVA